VAEGRFVGRSVHRVEDPKLLTGSTRFIDDLALPGMLHCAILRSPHAHARVLSVDTSEALSLPGVAAVVSGEDALRWTERALTVPAGWGTHCLATDRVRFAGEPVAAVAATSRALAEDALERIRVEYAPLPAVVDAGRAARPESTPLFEEHGHNIVFQRRFRWGDVEAAFRGADRVVERSFRWHRLGANPMETFGVISQWDPVEGSLTCHGSFQSQSQMALGRAASLRLPSHKVRLISQPHGGSFGGKGGSRGTDITALLSRKAGGRPVKWIEDRIEYMSGGASQSWDRHYTASLALDRDGRVGAFRVKLLDDLGATAEGFGAVSAAKPLASFTGCYAIPVAEYDLTIVATNKLPGSPYRGMGPPPHNLVLEQLMDVAARELALDPAEIRRRNFIPPDRFPYTIPSGNEYDSGNYEAALDAVLELSDYAALRARQGAARAQGRLFGIGVVSTIEPGVFDWNAYSILGMPSTGVPEGCSVAIDILGKVIVRVGFAHEGQGQYTIATQLLADFFGVELADVQVVPQDSLSAPPHFGPGGSRLGVALAGAVLGAAEKLARKLSLVAAHLLQTESEKIELRDGAFAIRGVPGAMLSLAQVAGTMLARSDLLPPGVEPSPEATYVWTAPGRTQPDELGRAKSYLTAANACHVVAIEIDRETGRVEILDYFIADDCGTRLNPATVEGMIQGGVAQGIGAALLEEYHYDASGQPLTATLMDYLLPTIHDVPETRKTAIVTPSPFTPLGAKGVGEGAMHTTPAAMLCAINDALSPLGVVATEIPATPERLWRLMKEQPR